MSPLDKAVLLKARLPEKTVEIPGVGEIRIRALSRTEVLEMQEGRERRGQVGSEVFCLSLAIVEPVLSEEEVRQLLDASPGGELQVVVDAVMALSGLTEGAQKSP